MATKKKQPPFDLQKAHRYFAADCFNRVWALMDQAERTPEEERTMIQLGLSSLWHWKQFEGCTDSNLSVGYWQISRIYAFAKQPENALLYGQLCLEISSELSPFNLGYAYEALARANQLAGNASEMKVYLKLAEESASLIENEEDQQALRTDLAAINAVV